MRQFTIDNTIMNQSHSEGSMTENSDIQIPEIVPGNSGQQRIVRIRKMRDSDNVKLKEIETQQIALLATLNAMKSDIYQQIQQIIKQQTENQKIIEDKLSNIENYFKQQQEISSVKQQLSPAIQSTPNPYQMQASQNLLNSSTVSAISLNSSQLVPNFNNQSMLSQSFINQQYNNQQILRSPLTLPNCESTLSATIQFITANQQFQYIINNIQQNVLQQFYQTYKSNSQTAVFNLQQFLFNKVQNWQQQTPFNLLIQLLQISITQAMPNTINQPAIAYRGASVQENYLDYINAQQIYMKSKLSQLFQLQTQHTEVCPRCGTVRQFEQLEFISLQVGAYTTMDVEQLVGDQFGSQQSNTQHICSICGGQQANYKRTIVNAGNCLFIAFSSVLHSKVKISRFLTLQVQNILQPQQPQQNLMYKLASVLLYEGEMQFSALILGSDGIWYYCNKQSILQRDISDLEDKVFAMMYIKVDV